MIPETIDISAASKRYKCSARTIRRRIKTGEIAAIMPGRQILVVLDSGDAWFNGTADRAKAACRPQKERGRK